MTTTLSEGVKVPDVGSVNWAGDLEINWNLLNGALANLSGNVKLDRDNTWTGEQSFTLPIVGSLTGTASKAIADEDGTSIKTGYVNVAGNQTVSGQKTWTATQTVKGAPPALNLQSTNIQRGVAPASNSNLNLYGKDLNGAELCRLIYRASPTGERRLWLGVNDDYSNGALSPTGTSTWNSLNLYLRADGKAETTFSADLLPATNNAYNLGSSSYQWRSIHVQNYYYNGTQWGLDRANVWSGANTFSAGVLTTMVETSPGNTGLVIRSTDQTWESGARIFLYSNTQTGQTNGSIYVDVDHGDNGNTKTGLTLVPNAFHPMGGTVNTTYGVSLGTATYQWAKVYSEQYYYNGTAWGLDKENQWLVKQIIKQDTIDITTNPSAEKIGKSLYFYDGSRFWAQYVPVWGTDGSFRMELGLSNYTTSGGQGYWVVANRISKDFTTLDFYTSHGNANLGTSTNKWKTLNGINPGALSLPSATYIGSNAIVEIDRTGWVYDGTANSYSPPVDCWLSISNGGSITVWGVNTAFGMKATDNIAIPLRLGETYSISLTHIPDFCRIYPCLGNV